MTIRFARRTAIVLCLMASAITPAVAHAGVPSYQDRADAKRFARHYWEDRGYYTDCWRVRITVERLQRNTNAFVYDGTCTIHMNRRTDWSDGGRRDPWWQVCHTVTHEFGHLPGIERRHNRNPDSIMARAVSLNRDAWWWPWFPACRYDGDDQDGDGTPDW